MLKGKNYFVVLKKLLFYIVSKQTKYYFIEKSNFYYNKQTQDKFNFFIKYFKNNL
jgi:hypothetical protein